MKPSDVLDEVERLGKQPRRVRVYLVVGAIAAAALIIVAKVADTYFTERAKRWAEAAEKPSTGKPVAPAVSTSEPPSERAAQTTARAPADPGQVFTVDIVNAPVRGPADAPLTVVEFVDFEGPFAKTLDEHLRRLEDELPGKIRRVYKNAPLPIHKHSRPAARAALAAADQGKFWPMHDALFQSQDRLNANTIEELAVQVGIGRTEFLAALARVDDDRIVRDIRQAKELGLKQFPVVFINGRKISQLQPYAAYRTLANQLLAER